MNRAFMKQFYETSYPDPVVAVAPRIPNYAQLTKEQLKKSTALCEACGGMTSPLWQMVEQYAAVIDATTLEIIQEAYLLGAEDREKMLK